MLKLMGSFLILAGGVLVRQRCVRAWRQEQEALASLAGALERLAEEYAGFRLLRLHSCSLEGG